MDAVERVGSGKRRSGGERGVHRGQIGVSGVAGAGWPGAQRAGNSRRLSLGGRIEPGTAGFSGVELVAQPDCAKCNALGMRVAGCQRYPLSDQVLSRSDSMAMPAVFGSAGAIGRVGSEHVSQR